MSIEILNRHKVILWDFDGVIKESNVIKKNAYAKMFSKYGNETLEKVLDHHCLNGGISREVKIPLYFNQFVGIHLSSQEIDEKCMEYSRLVIQAVIKSQWVPGALDYLNSNSRNQRFVLVTGTPRWEIIEILTHLDILECFQSIYGSPTTKLNAIHQELKSGTKVQDCLFIGDSITDCEAAKFHRISFLLRETDENKILFLNYSGPRFYNFLKLYEST
jgi:HAD superfamily hydrolase (TIGR01549 family)